MGPVAPRNEKENHLLLHWPLMDARHASFAHSIPPGGFSLYFLAPFWCVEICLVCGVYSPTKNPNKRQKKGTGRPPFYFVAIRLLAGFFFRNISFKRYWTFFFFSISISFYILLFVSLFEGIDGPISSYQQQKATGSCSRKQKKRYNIFSICYHRQCLRLVTHSTQKPMRNHFLLCHKNAFCASKRVVASVSLCIGVWFLSVLFLFSFLYI